MVCVSCSLTFADARKGYVGGAPVVLCDWCGFTTVLVIWRDGLVFLGMSGLVRGMGLVFGSCVFGAGLGWDIWGFAAGVSFGCVDSFVSGFWFGCSLSLGDG